MSIWSIVVALIILGLLVTIHELGHFWVARLLKIRVFEVSIFVGPKLVDWRKNDVEYTIRALPVSAYVRFTEMDENGNAVVSDDPDLLINSPRWKRLIVALAGPFMNMILGIVLFAVIYCSLGFTSLDIGAVIPDSQLEQTIITEQTPFEIGDTIVKINGSRVETYLDYYYMIENDISEADNVTLTMRSRDTGDTYDLTLVPQIGERPMLGVTHYAQIDEKYNGWEIYSVSDYQNNGNPILRVGDYLTKVDGKSVADEDFDEYFSSLTDGDTMRLTYIRNGVEYEEDCVKTIMLTTNLRGIILFAYDVEDPASFFGALKTAALMPYTIVNVSVRSISQVFKGEEEVYNMVSGPVGMTSVVSDVVDDVDDSWTDKLISVVQIAGIISIGLMFTNLLPIPGLDGIQVILIIVEMIIGHPLSKKSENVLNVVGFVLLICLVVFAFASDIIRIILE